MTVSWEHVLDIVPGLPRSNESAVAFNFSDASWGRALGLFKAFMENTESFVCTGTSSDPDTGVEETGISEEEDYSFSPVEATPVEEAAAPERISRMDTAMSDEDEYNPETRLGELCGQSEWVKCDYNPELGSEDSPQEEELSWGPQEEELSWEDGPDNPANYNLDHGPPPPGYADFYLGDGQIYPVHQQDVPSPTRTRELSLKAMDNIVNLTEDPEHDVLEKHDPLGHSSGDDTYYPEEGEIEEGDIEEMDDTDSYSC
jgi:hypothetical protein